MIADAEKAGWLRAGRDHHRGHRRQHRHGSRASPPTSKATAPFSSSPDKMCNEKIHALTAFGAEVEVMHADVDPEIRPIVLLGVVDRWRKTPSA